MQDEKVRTFSDLELEELELLSRLLKAVANAIEQDLNVRLEKFYIEDSAGTLVAGIERMDPEGGEPDA